MSASQRFQAGFEGRGASEVRQVFAEQSMDSNSSRSYDVCGDPETNNMPSFGTLDVSTVTCKGVGVGWGVSV